jgi:hypothetical protein
MLIGQCPETALNAVSSSIRFWSQQQQLKKNLMEEQFQTRLRKNEQRMAKVRRPCKVSPPHALDGVPLLAACTAVPSYARA